jgi:hypothetical protein
MWIILLSRAEELAAVEQITPKIHQAELVAELVDLEQHQGLVFRLAQTIQLQWALVALRYLRLTEIAEARLYLAQLHRRAAAVVQEDNLVLM